MVYADLIADIGFYFVGEVVASADSFMVIGFYFVGEVVANADSFMIIGFSFAGEVVTNTDCVRRYMLIVGHLWTEEHISMLNDNFVS